MKLIFALLIFLLPLISQAQQSDSQLAYTYYQNKDYEKAAELFLQLYQRTRSSNYLDYHIICLINGKQYDKAEEVLKKVLKTDDNNKDFLVNLGYIYEQQGKFKKAQEYYEKAVHKLIPQSTDVLNLANKFRNIREYSWMSKTYLRGRELLKKTDAFINELGETYMLERDYENMLALFIKSLQLKPSDINSITSKLSFARSYDLINNVDKVIEAKLAEIYGQPDYNPVFDELGIWYALQKKNYPDALKHAVLLNQKSEEDKIYTFLNIAREATDANEYSIALEAYNKVLEKGKEKNNFYTSARKEILNCRYKQFQQQKAGRTQYMELADNCGRYMQEYGYTSANVDIAILLSDLYAYQLQQPDSANLILEKSTRIRQLNPTTLSLLKSKRADLLAFMDNVWEATILYTQIEKSNPNNDIGYEAKLKKAWLAYYSGDLIWAKAQFDVLKGATSKLISNDAIQMSHFINMNYEEGEDNQDLEKLAQAEYRIYKKQYTSALATLDSLLENSNAGISDRAALDKANVLCQKSRYEEAEAILLQLKEHADQTSVKAEAIFSLAGLKKQLKDIAQARELYKLLVSEYSGSVYSVEAGRLYRELDKQ